MPVNPRFSVDDGDAPVTNPENSVPDGSSCRVCPSCLALDEFPETSLLWPPDWRCDSCGHDLPDKHGIACLAPDLDGQIEGFDPAAFAHLAQMENGHFWFAARNRLIAWLSRRYAPNPGRILEIGCGSGFVLGALQKTYPDARVAGSELHSLGLAVAKERHGESVELVQMDARAIGLRNCFSLAGAFDVLEHIPEDEAVLEQIGLALKPAGIFIATVPQHPWLWSAADDYAEHQRRYRVGELGRKIGSAGMKVIYSDSFVSFLLPLMVASRMAGKIMTQPDKPQRPDEMISREFRMSPIVNNAFTMVMSVEHALRRAGVRFPFGGSQVIVARKPASR